MLRALAVFGILVSGSHAAVYTNPSSIASKAYDFIVVGAGNAGAVLGGRLSENPSFKILVIEAGGPVDNIEVVEVPILAGHASPNLAINWNYTLVANPSLNGRSLPYPRGFVAGGTSSINFCVWTRGSNDDFNRLASVSGDSGWSWNSLVPYFQKAEGLVQPTGGQNVVGDYTPGVLGTNGPIKLSLPNKNITYFGKGINVTWDPLYPDVTYNQDVNSGHPLGLGWLTSSVGGGIRSTSMNYLTADTFAARPNVDLLLNTRVTKLTFNVTSPLAVNGVTIQQSRTGNAWNITAAKEVILSAGSLATPQLLLLSGIGPAAALTAKGIEVKYNNPNVGSNLIDHPWVVNKFSVNTTDTADSLNYNATYAAQQGELYAANHTGMLSEQLAGVVQFGRLPYIPGVLDSKTDVAAGPNSPHYEIVFGGGFLQFLETSAPTMGNYVALATIIVSPNSKGSVTLATTNVWDNPVIDTKFLSTPHDKYIMSAAILQAKRLAASSAFKNFFIAPYGDFAETNTPGQILEYAESWTGSIWHPVGTAAMGKKGTSDGVVNPDLTVKGVAGLRVVDASVFPYIISAHPQAAVFALAERAADLIKASW